MSREVIVRIRDDFDGSDADETVVFSYRGQSYEIDLAATNVERFDKTMQEWIDVARTVEQKPAAAAKNAAAKSTRMWPSKPPQRVLQQRRQIRDWARANGFDVQDRGQIAASIVNAFQLANPSVTLLAGTVGNSVRTNDAALTSVTAQQAENGLLSITELTSSTVKSERGAASSSTVKSERGAASSLAVKSERGAACAPGGAELTKEQRDDVRAWAAENGYEQAPNGQIKREVLAAYFAAKD